MDRSEPTAELFHLSGKRKSKIRNIRYAGHTPTVIRFGVPPDRSQKRKKREGSYSGVTDLRWESPEPSNYEEQRQRTDSLKNTFAKWLETVADWDWFATYTFSEPIPAHSAHGLLRTHFNWLKKQAGTNLCAFRADEYGLLHGRFHMHALLANVGDFPRYCEDFLPPDAPARPCCAVHSWIVGYARVLRYDPGVGATGYVTKYVTKDEFGDWELWGL